jgi:Predicted cobalamin binding protein
MDKFDELRKTMAELDDEKFYGLLEEIMSQDGVDAQKTVDVCQDGIKEVGVLFENGEYYVGDLVFAGEMLTKGMEIIKPVLGGAADKSLGKMILCTVKDDLHDIGKNIVKALLEAAGMTVVDLGIDTPADKILETVKAQDIKIIALSGVLTLAIGSMTATVKTFEEAGLRDKVKIIIGGNPVTEEACKLTGADEWAINPQKTIDVCTRWAANL